VPDESVTLLKLTEEERVLAASWGVNVSALPKNASLEHQYLKKLVAEHYRGRSCGVEEEVQIGGGQAVDLVAARGDERIAIEIETGKSEVLKNIKKVLGAGFQRSEFRPVSRVADHELKQLLLKNRLDRNGKVIIDPNT